MQKARHNSRRVREMAVKKQFAVSVINITDAKNPILERVELVTCKTKAAAADDIWAKLEGELFAEKDGTITAAHAAQLIHKAYRLKVDIHRSLACAGYDKPEVRAQKRAEARKKAAQKKAAAAKTAAGRKAAVAKAA